MNKQPVIDLAFWIMKISATTLGETAGDLLSMTWKIGYAASTVGLLGVFGVALVIQLLSKRYHPILYWSVILATSTAGTTLSDYMDRSLKLGYVVLARHFTSISRVVLFWIAFVLTRPLGAERGDLLSKTSGLGTLGSSLILATILGLAILRNRC